MADITRFRFISHLRANPTTHVRHLRNGKLVHDGAGQAFWFRRAELVAERDPGRRPRAAAAVPRPDAATSRT